MNLIPSLSHHVHKQLKDVIFQVVWTNLGDSRNDWFATIIGNHSRGRLQEFKVVCADFEIEGDFFFSK